MQIIPHFFFVFPPPRLTSPASATSSAIVPRPALLLAFTPYTLHPTLYTLHLAFTPYTGAPLPLPGASFWLCFETNMYAFWLCFETSMYKFWLCFETNYCKNICVIQRYLVPLQRKIKLTYVSTKNYTRFAHLGSL